MLSRAVDEKRSVPEDARAAPSAGPADPPSRTAWVLDAITMAGGLLCGGIGVTMMVAWSVRATAVLRLGGRNPMVFNTALALAVTGAALVALAARRPRAVLAAGVFDAALGLAVLAEYALGRGLGIDQLAVHAYISQPTQAPGRVAVNTAVCLLVAAAGQLAWGPWRTRRRPAALAAAASLIAAIAITATFGYATGAPSAYGWGHLTAMALVTAIALLVLALALLSAAWRDARRGQGRLPGWLPVPAGMLALGLAASVWLAIVGDAGRITAGTATVAGTVLGVVMAILVALVVWLAHRADGQRRDASAEAARRAEAEAAARESENRLYQFLDALPVGVFIAAAGGQPHYANSEAKRLLGRGVEPDIGAAELAETYDVYVAGTDRRYPTERLPVVRALLGQPSHINDQEIRRPDGAVIPLEVWGLPVYGTGGNIDYAVAAFADMSERNARERTITGQAALLELAHDAIFVWDPDGRITYWNAGAERTYGFTRAEAIGRTGHQLLHTEFTEPLADITATMSRDGSWEGELAQQRADGRTIIVQSRWAVHRQPGAGTRTMEINRDITSRKQAEAEALRRANEIQDLNATLEQQVQQRTAHLETANKNLQAYSYSIAHDLRTPLRAISGYAEILAHDYGDRLDETGRNCTGRIQAASTHMSDLIDALLHMSQMSKAEMNLQDIDLSAETTAICEHLRARDPCRRVRATVEDGIRVTADRTLIRTVLENLLENAWKFTAHRDDATIEFGTAPTGDDSICCYVRDNGAGFDPAYAAKLFQNFQRLHPASEFPGTGTGIGLANARRIIERHHGRIWAEGATGHGATFYFTLNAKDTPMNDTPIPLAEDNPHHEAPPLRTARDVTQQP